MLSALCARKSTELKMRGLGCHHWHGLVHFGPQWSAVVVGVRRQKIVERGWHGRQPNRLKMKERGWTHTQRLTLSPSTFLRTNIQVSTLQHVATTLQKLRD